MKDLEIDLFSALLFDLDGTLIDSMPLHNKAWIETLKSFNCEMTSEILQEYAGITNIKTVEIFNERFGWNLDPQLMIRLKEAKATEYLKSVSTIESTLAIVKKYQGKIPMAIVTGGNLVLVESLLHDIGLKQYFSVLICAESTTRGKPFPDPFLLAAEKLKVLPVDCLVFEDGDAGIRAAISCGMSLVQVEPGGKLQVLVNKK